MSSVQFSLEMQKPPKKQRVKLSETKRNDAQNRAEARMYFKRLKSNRPWQFDDRAKSLLLKYYGIHL